MKGTHTVHTQTSEAKLAHKTYWSSIHSFSFSLKSPWKCNIREICDQNRLLKAPVINISTFPKWHTCSLVVICEILQSSRGHNVSHFSFCDLKWSSWVSSMRPFMHQCRPIKNGPTVARNTPGISVWSYPLYYLLDTSREYDAFFHNSTPASFYVHWFWQVTCHQSIAVSPCGIGRANHGARSMNGVTESNIICKHINSNKGAFYHQCIKQSCWIRKCD